MDEKNTIKLLLDLDKEKFESEIDGVTEKVEKLASVLKEANSLLDELTSKRC
ncbi:hypothetical protein AB9M75_08030 [Lactobacillus sp. AN1001]